MQHHHCFYDSAPEFIYDSDEPGGNKDFNRPLKSPFLDVGSCAAFCRHTRTTFKGALPGSALREVSAGMPSTRIGVFWDYDPMQTTPRLLFHPLARDGNCIIYYVFFPVDPPPV